MLPSEKNAEKPVKPASKNTYVMTLMITVTDEAALKAEATKPPLEET